MATLQAEMLFVERARKPQPQPEAVPIDLFFPEDKVNELAQLECYNKHLFRPNTYLHKWWARRSGTTFRYILKQLVADAVLRDYYKPGGLEGVTVLDPMMGGGTTIHEAIRMGANVIGCDLDPIPVLQVRASLARVSPAAAEKAFAEFLQPLEKKLAPYFQTACPKCRKIGEVQFILHGARKQCGCGEALVVDSFQLREESDGSEIRMEKFYPAKTARRGTHTWKLFEKGYDRCEACSSNLRDPDETLFALRYIPLIVVGTCPEHSLFFKAVDDDDLACIQKAQRAAVQLDLPATSELQIPSGPKSRDLLSREVRCYSELFSARQLLYLATAKQALDAAKPEHRLLLGLLVSTSLEYHCMLTGYKGADKRRAGAIRHVFSHHAYSFPYTALEANPVFSQNTSGTLRRLFKDRVAAACEWASAPIERQITPAGWRKVAVLGEVDGGQEVATFDDLAGGTRRFFIGQRDSSKLPLPDCSVDFVVTDPPYFDSVQYSDLSHFFRVWLRWLLPDHADWHFTATSSAVAETEIEGEKFGRVLGAIFGQCNRVLRRPHGRLIFTYHHWRPEAWTQLTLALRAAGFRLVNTFTVYSENPISVHIRKLNALKHDSVLILQPVETNASPRWEKPPLAPNGDSYEFCRRCGIMLGWLLDSDLDSTQIAAAWREMLKGK
jgi:putative DNA methylase